MRYFAKSNFQKQLDVFCKKGVLRNFEKLTGKQLCLQPLTIITKYSILDVAAVLDPPLLRILILLKKVEYFFWVWMTSLKNCGRQWISVILWTSHNQTLIWKMFVIGQKLKHLHVAYSSHELFLFFWLTLIALFELWFLTASNKSCT